MISKSQGRQRLGEGLCCRTNVHEAEVGDHAFVNSVLFWQMILRWPGWRSRDVLVANACVQAHSV